MVEATERGAIEKGLRVLWIIWAAMLGSLLIYVFICHQFGEEIRRTASPDFPTGQLKNILYVVVIATLFITYFLRKLILSSRFSSSDAKLFKPETASNQPAFLTKYTTAMIVSLALSESIGIYGLVLFLIGDSFQTLYIFTGISAAAMFFYRPKREDLETIATAIHTKSAPPPEL
jgi:MFS family permease